MASLNTLSTTPPTILNRPQAADHKPLFTKIFATKKRLAVFSYQSVEIGPGRADPDELKA
jgi:hypothetical protein